MTEQETETVQTETISLHSMELANISEAMPRILDSFRILLNLENEAMTMLRDIRRERDNDRLDAAEKDFTEILYDLMKYTHSPDFLKDYFGRLGVEQLKMIGNVFSDLLALVTKEAEGRVKELANSLQLAIDDARAKASNLKGN